MYENKGIILAKNLDPAAQPDLNRILAYHGLEADDPYLVYACLACGSVGLCNGGIEEVSRLHDFYNFECCGTTVLFHTSG